jgi:hypothetical protein
LILGAPLLFCFLAGRIGGWNGAILFVFLLLLLLWMPFMAAATGAPAREALPPSMPLAAGIAGFIIGTSLPTVVRVP